MSLRCAVCGSKRITIETKKEGYDLKKGVIGQALIGIPGALAGINGKDTTYYHCADCGQVLNRAMYAFESNWIDSMLEKPDLWRDSLKNQKEKYKNIEWEDKDINATQPVPVLEKNVSGDDKVNQIEEEVLIYLNNIGTAVEEEKISKKYEEDSMDYYIAYLKLLESGRVVIEKIGDKNYLRLIKDVNEIRENVFKQGAIDESKEFVLKNYDALKERFLQKVEIGRTYTKNEYDSIRDELFKDEIISDNPYFYEFFCREMKVRFYINEILIIEDENKISERYTFRSAEEAESIVNEAERKREEERENEKQKQFSMILDFLEKNPYEKFTITEMQNKDKVLSQNSNQRLSALLKQMEQRGLVEKSIHMKKNYFALAGYEERLKEKRLKEQQQIRERLIKDNEILDEKNESLRKEIEELEKEKEKQYAIWEENKKKIFGAGAKAKKEANAKIETLENDIKILENKISNNTKTIEENSVLIREMIQTD